MAQSLVLSYIQVEPIFRAGQENETSVVVSLDLGLTTVTVTIGPDFVSFPNGARLTWENIEKIRHSKTKCFGVEDDTLKEIQVFSETTNQLYSLMPTEAAPTMLISGISMHRIKGIEPHHDTLLKIETIAPVVGRVLDTATGLGYTAIQAARTAQQVITIELDPAALEVARLNPWSRALFDNSKITQLVGDSFDRVQEFEDEAFSQIIHDPPMFSLAGDLYSGEFYRQLFRVLKRGGRMFHYIGDLDSQSGRRVAKGVIRRLQESGFARISRRPEAFGLVAYK